MFSVGYRQLFLAVTAPFDQHLRGTTDCRSADMTRGRALRPVLCACCERDRAKWTTYSTVLCIMAHLFLSSERTLSTTRVCITGL